MVFGDVFTQLPTMPPLDIPPAARPAEALDAVAFARTRLRFQPDDHQTRVLESEAQRGILNCARQWGKSTVMSAKAVHRAYTRPGSLVLVVSPSERQSGEFVRKVREFVVRLGIRPRGDGHNALSVALPNGSRIVGLPGVEDTGRGFSQVSMMVIDEAARVDDAIYKMLRPMLAVGGGDLWLMSTPDTKRGFFYDAWELGGARWERFRVPGTENPRIAREFLEEERGNLGIRFRSEYLCEFLDDGEAVFGRDLVERALDDEVEPLLLRTGFTSWKRK